jgi:hypothetical protein
MRMKYWLVNAVAKMCNCHKNTVIAWAKEQNIAKIPIGKYGLYILNQYDIARFKERNAKRAVDEDDEDDEEAAQTMRF